MYCRVASGNQLFYFINKVLLFYRTYMRNGSRVWCGPCNIKSNIFIRTNLAYIKNVALYQVISEKSLHSWWGAVIRRPLHHAIVDHTAGL